MVVALPDWNSVSEYSMSARTAVAVRSSFACVWEVLNEFSHAGGTEPVFLVTPKAGINRSGTGDGLEGQNAMVASKHGSRLATSRMIG